MPTFTILTTDAEELSVTCEATDKDSRLTAIANTIGTKLGIPREHQCVMRVNGDGREIRFDTEIMSMADGEGLALIIDEPFRTDKDRELWQWLVDWADTCYKKWALDSPEEADEYGFSDGFAPGYHRARVWEQNGQWVFDVSALTCFLNMYMSEGLITGAEESIRHVLESSECIGTPGEFFEIVDHIQGIVTHRKPTTWSESAMDAMMTPEGLHARMIVGDFELRDGGVYLSLDVTLKWEDVDKMVIEKRTGPNNGVVVDVIQTGMVADLDEWFPFSKVLSIDDPRDTGSARGTKRGRDE